jgi:hypothetical protein
VLTILEIEEILTEISASTFDTVKRQKKKKKKSKPLMVLVKGKATEVLVFHLFLVSNELLIRKAQKVAVSGHS